MKVVAYSLSGKSVQFDLDAGVNLRELQSKVAKGLGYNDIYTICITNVKNQDNVQLLNGIFHDDSGDENLFDFIKNKTTHPEAEINELKIYVMQNLGAGHYRPTRQNPQGINSTCGLISNPDSKFFQSAVNSGAGESYSEQIERLGLTDQVPNSFLDPITTEIMDKPVMATDQRTYNLKTLASMNFVSPFSKQKVTYRDNLALRAEIEDFIANSKPEIQNEPDMQNLPEEQEMSGSCRLF